MTDDPDRPTWLTVAAAATELGVGQLVVRNLTSTGELPAVQGVDGRWRIDRGEFEAWIRAQYARTRREKPDSQTSTSGLAAGP